MSCIQLVGAAEDSGRRGRGPAYTEPGPAGGGWAIQVHVIPTVISWWRRKTEFLAMYVCVGGVLLEHQGLGILANVTHLSLSEGKAGGYTQVVSVPSYYHPTDAAFP